MKKKEPKVFKSYPEVISIFTAIFISGILISEQFSPELYIAWFGVSVLAVCISYITKVPKNKTLTLIIAALTASMFYAASRYIPQSDFSDFLELDQTKGTLYGRFTGKTTLSGKKRISYEFDRLTYNSDEQTIDIPGSLYCKSIANKNRLYPEQYYSMTGQLKISSFNEKPVFEIASFTSIEPPNLYIPTIAKQIQIKIKQNLTSVLKKEHSAIIIGLLLGDTSLISDKSLFIETGVSHLLAISGQHIMILIFLIAAVLHWFKIPPVSRSIMTAIILFFYAMITVGSPSVWRALIMYICVAITFHLESTPSPVGPVSIAALLILLYDPSLIHNAAFILTFTAVLSIIFLRQPLEYAISKLQLPEVISRYLAVTFAANIGTMPMVAYIFGTVSLSSIIVNPLILWTFTFILPTAFFIAALATISIPAAVFLSPGLSLLLDNLISFLEYAKSFSWLYFYVGNLNGSIILAIYALLLFATLVFNKWRLKQVRKKLQKQEIEKIPVKAFPKKETAKIRINNASKAMQTLIGKNRPLEVKQPSKNKASNAFEAPEIVEAMDEILCGLNRVPLNKNVEQKKEIHINCLSVEGQNLYHRLFSMDEKLFYNERQRLLQAHIFMLAISGYEILNRINSNLNPPLSTDRFNIKVRVKDRQLSVSILSDNIMRSLQLLHLSSDQQMSATLQQGQMLYAKARELLEYMLSDKNFEDCVKLHISLRERFIEWCCQFVHRDNFLKLQRKKNPR